MTNQQLQQQRAEAKVLRDRLKKEEPYRFFIPNGKQEEFLYLNNFIRMFLGGNGTGKTAIEANIIANICVKDNNEINSWFRDISYFKDLQRPTRGRIISSATVITEVVIPELEKWLPMNKVTRSKEFKPYYKKWKLNGHEFDIMTTEQEPKEHEGVTLDWLICDEPPTHQIFDVYPSRFRSQNSGAIFLMMTPLTDAGWIYDELYNKQKERDVGVVYSSCWDASVTKGVRGHLSDVFIDRLVEQYKDTPEELEARVEGKFMHLAGLVFKNFNRIRHVIPVFSVPEWWDIYEVIDAHEETPDAISWFTTDELGYKYQLDELWFSGDVIGKEAEQIAEKRKQWKQKPVLTICEPRMKNEDKHTGTSTLELLAQEMTQLQEPFSFELGSKDLDGGIIAIRNSLNPIKAETPLLRITEKCVHTIWEMERLVWQKHANKTADKKSPPNKPMDKDDHFIENMRRFLLYNPSTSERKLNQYQELIKKQQQFSPNVYGSY